MLNNIGLDRETTRLFERGIDAFEKLGDELERLNDNLEGE